jgi:3-deoxy-D-manno-octulosonic-acid transferase
MRLFLRRARPQVGLVLEIEIWPAMLIEATRIGVPMMMVNGNLLERSMGNMRWPNQRFINH